MAPRPPTQPDDVALDHPVIQAIRPLVDAIEATFISPDESDPSDVVIEWDGVALVAVRRAPLHGALDRLVRGVENDLGASLASLSREDKQRAVRLLDERGAFILRRAVEDVADRLGVSRITVYNYLNAIHR
jgi:hypothetical protein